MISFKITIILLKKPKKTHFIISEIFTGHVCKLLKKVICILCVTTHTILIYIPFFTGKNEDNLYIIVIFSPFHMHTSFFNGWSSLATHKQ